LGLLCYVPPALFALGLACIGVAIATVLRLGRLCRARPRIEAGVLVLDMGRCGCLEVPLGSVKRVDYVEDPGPARRLFGTEVPKRFYAGSFRFERLAEALVYSERLRGLVLFETWDGRRLLLGWGTARLLDELKRLAGSGQRGEPRVKPSTAPLKLAVAAYVLVLALAVCSLAVFPEKMVFLGSVESRSDALLMILVFAATGFIDIVVLYALGRRLRASCC